MAFGVQSRSRRGAMLPPVTAEEARDASPPVSVDEELGGYDVVLT